MKLHDVLRWRECPRRGRRRSSWGRRSGRTPTIPLSWCRVVPRLPPSPTGSPGQFQCCGSEMFILDPNFFHHGSGSAILNWHRILVFLTPKKLLLSAQKYEPGCLSPDLLSGFLSSRIPDPGGPKSTGSLIRLLQHSFFSTKCPAYPFISYFRVWTQAEIGGKERHFIGMIIMQKW
jgi:hypothetical protein